MKPLLIGIIPILLRYSVAFNISPQPNLIFTQPDLTTFKPNNSPTFFGYSLTLRKNSLMIGAPKSESHLASQRLVNKTGTVYKCDLKTNKCANFVVDNYGNTHVEKNYYQYNSEKKDDQLLGYTMDGHANDNDRFVVCAPNLKSEVGDQYLLNGICYLTQNTLSLQPKIIKIAPLRSKDSQLIKSQSGLNIYNYMLAQGGLSIHITDDNEEILIGAVGIRNWQGGIIRYRFQESKIEVVNPVYSTFNDDSYFGFAISSANFFGNDNFKTLYIASAPQARKQVGEACIFDIIPALSFGDVQESSAKIYYKFISTQMGEYFGYSLLAEDINGDGLADVLIGAPFYSKSGYFENGAVYVYMNQGNLKFAKPNLLTSNYELNGRFGMSIAKVGDLNLDGYNDIAVGAPLEESGVVYIYHGSRDGMFEAIQKITPQEKAQMFGLSISRGVDIDSNQYNDFAIGAPGSQKAFIYKTYPIIEIVASIETRKREIQASEKQIQATACWSYFSKTVNHSIDLQVTLRADIAHDRAKWINNNKSMTQNITISTQIFCVEFDVGVRYMAEHIFAPISIEMEYKILNSKKINATKFCEDCVLVDPKSSKIVSTSVIYSTGCKTAVCESDLIVKSALLDVKVPFVLGTSKTIAIMYSVENIGETAYLPQIHVKIENSTSFSRIPPNCHLEKEEMFCDLNQLNPLYSNESTSLVIHIDTTTLKGDELVVDASVTSAGIEVSKENNQVITLIELTELSHLEIYGKSLKTHLNMDGVRENITRNVNQIISVVNRGPSQPSSNLNLIVKIPVAYYSKNEWRQIVENISLEGRYQEKLLNSTKLNIETDYDETTMSLIVVDFDEPILPKLEGTDSNETNDVGFIHSMHKRETNEDDFPRSEANIIDHLPEKKSIILSCRNNDEETIKCAEYRIEIKDFSVGSDAIKISLNFSINSDALLLMDLEGKDLLITETTATIEKLTNENLLIKIIEGQSPYFIIFRSFESSQPIWIFAVAILAGLIVLATLSLVLKKLGFFRRVKKEELEKLTKTVSTNVIDDTTHNHASYFIKG